MCFCGDRASTVNDAPTERSHYRYRPVSACGTIERRVTPVTPSHETTVLGEGTRRLPKPDVPPPAASTEVVCPSDQSYGVTVTRPSLSNPRSDPAFALHRGGKLEVRATVPVRDADDLALAYTPGVARVCTAIADSRHWSRTIPGFPSGRRRLRRHRRARARRHRPCGGDARDGGQGAAVQASSPTSTRCRSASTAPMSTSSSRPWCGSRRLRRYQPRGHQRAALLRDRGPAAGTCSTSRSSTTTSTAPRSWSLAALLNAAQVTGRPLGELRAVVAGAGASGVAVTASCWTPASGTSRSPTPRACSYEGREGINPVKDALARDTNRAGYKGSTEEALRRRRRLHRPVRLDRDARRRSPHGRATRSCSRCPTRRRRCTPRWPQVRPGGGDRPLDFPNQINNVLAFPGVFRGALDVRASDDHREHEGRRRRRARRTWWATTSPRTTSSRPVRRRVAPAVTAAVADQARADGVARR